jgi:hypothetical protein
MKALSYLVSFTMAICGLAFIELPALAAAANITGTWEVTIHYPPPDGDYLATYVLKQDSEKITGTLPRHVRSSRCHGDHQVERCDAERDGARRDGALLG